MGMPAAYRGDSCNSTPAGKTAWKVDKLDKGDISVWVRTPCVLVTVRSLSADGLQISGVARWIRWTQACTTLHRHLTTSLASTEKVSIT